MVEQHSQEIWSFFTGAMGLDLGLEKGGFHVTLANEVDSRCCDTIMLNRPELQLVDETIAERPGKHWSLKHYDGPTKAKDGDAPPLEPDELSGSAIRKILGDVKRLRYAVEFGVLDAADYGAPQHRLRFIMVGAREGAAPALPDATHGLHGSGLQPFRTVRDAIFGFQQNPGPGSEYTPRVRRYFSLVPAGGNWRDLPVELQQDALGGSWAAGGGKTGFYRRLPWDAPSPTIIARANRKGSALCHPASVRPISVREAAALQGFPADWQFAGSMNAQYQQVGNAVPVPLGKAIAESLARRMPTGSAAAPEGVDFDAMLVAAVARLRSSARNKTPQRERHNSVSDAHRPTTQR